MTIIDSPNPQSSPSPDAATAEIAWRDDRALWLIMALAALLGLIYNFVILPGFGPDEPRHFNYVRLLFEEHRLPFLQPDGSEYRGAHSLHPPLYYFLLLPFYAMGRALPGDGVWHLLRLVSLLLCLAALPLWHQIAARASGRRSVARLSVAILALLPIFGMTAGVVNNDAASVLAVALFLWLLVVRFDGEMSGRAALWLGLCLGLGVLCKATVLLCDGAALLVYFAAQNRWRGAAAWNRLATTGLIAALVAVPWYARNFQLYGKFSPIESGYSNPALPSPANGFLVMMLHDNFPALFAYANWGIFYSQWSQKDWFPEAARTPIYGFLALLGLMAAIGHAIGRRHRDDEKRARRAVRGALHGAFAINWLACLGMALFVHWGWAEGGRYLLASLGGLAVFLAAGWHALLNKTPSAENARAEKSTGEATAGEKSAGEARMRGALVAWSVFALALNGLAIYWLLAFLNPTFGPKS